MASIYLQATINGKVAGTLWQDQQGIAHFAYDPSYHGAPLSIALPLKNQSFHNIELLPYLFGLLPDSERQRSAIAREFGIRPNNAIAMLEHIGLDCPGGVQFFPMSQNGDRSIAGPRPATYKPLSNRQIALRLKSVRDDNDATWLGKNESWALGGNQGKFALAWHNGSWNSALGSATSARLERTPFHPNGTPCRVDIYIHQSLPSIWPRPPKRSHLYRHLRAEQLQRAAVSVFLPARLPSRLLCVLCPRPRRQRHRGRLARLPGTACCASAYAVCTCGRETGAAPGRFPQGVFEASFLGTPWENNRGATPCRSVDYPRRRSIRMVSSVSAHATSEKTAPTAPVLTIPGPATTADPTAIRIAFFPRGAGTIGKAKNSTYLRGAL